MGSLEDAVTLKMNGGKCPKCGKGVAITAAYEVYLEFVVPEDIKTKEDVLITVQDQMHGESGARYVRDALGVTPGSLSWSCLNEGCYASGDLPDSYFGEE